VDGPARGDAAAPRGDHGGPVPCPMLFTPAQAAHLLQVRESWLRRRAAQRRIPCTFLGKHLRFSPANLNQIITDAADAADRTSGHRPAPPGSGPAQASTRRSSAPIPTRRQQRPTG
jgi:excisionase family DNA binding protein